MRRIFSLIIVMAMIFALRATTYAAPFLVCDEYKNPPPGNSCLPDAFLVQLDNNGIWIPTPAQVSPSTGSTRLYFDLSGVAAGPHTAKVKAKCSQQKSESVESAPFPFRK